MGTKSSGGNIFLMKMETESGIKTGDYMFNAVHTTDWGMSRKRWNTGGSSGRLPCNTKVCRKKGWTVRIDHRSYVRQGH